MTGLALHLTPVPGEPIHDIMMFEPPLPPERMLDALAEMLHRFLYPRAP